ncbi:winged helix-turn-helix domain-containing protein [Bradyrhizobium manausense]|uniref:winged helix-turn-helix domain-containing protein n=1 Tax=Bradyrhizobium manausense TaxID=989370 RepID=UPI0009FB81AE|nr:winged helix-turn-helix domain-containing protein [Bradyrhizobium manausense]
MSSAYLHIAEQVLASSGQPLSAAEIVREARRRRLVPAHLYGVRQDRTLQARLSENIAKYGEESRFFRAAPGRYFLRDLQKTTGQEIGEYYARPRRKELSATDVLVLDADLKRLLRRDGATVSFSKVLDCLSAGQYSYRAVEDILADKTAAAVHSFVVVHDTRRVLSFRCGRFFPRTDPLYGRRTIGLGGAVTAKQVDLLFESLFGIVASAIDELCSGIGLPRRLAERARYGGEIKPWFGVHSRPTDHSPTTLHMVLSYRCPAEFTPTKAALSVNDLRWIDPNTMPNCLEDYDTTSQFLLSQEYVRDLVRQAA